MYKAILCDDNEIILEGLGTQLDWESLGVRLVATAADGEAALELLKLHMPDILITDIRMPFRSGLELIREGKALNPTLVTVIISGYNDFEYARTAVRLGTVDYVLKPINLDDLNAALRRSVSLCEKQQAGKHSTMVGVLGSLLRRELEPEVARELCTEVGLNPDQFCCVLRLHMEKLSAHQLPEDERYEAAKRFARFLDLADGSGAYAAEKREGACTLVVCGETGLEVSDHSRRLVDQARQEVFRDEDGVLFYTGGIHSGLLACADSLVECEQAMELRFLKGAKEDIHYNDIREFAGDIVGEDASSLFHIDFLGPLKQQNRDLLEDRLLQFREGLQKAGGDSYLYMTLRVGDIYARTVRDLRESGIDIRKVLANPMESFKRVGSASTLDGAISTLRENLLAICDYIAANKSKYAGVIDTALRYIGEHYSSPRLSIEDVAAAAYMSPGHFSTIFKSEMSMTFTDYLIGIRMEKAQELLANTGEKIYEISQQVGYENAAYFSSAFKKYTGKSPQEYRSGNC